MNRNSLLLLSGLAFLLFLSGCKEKAVSARSDAEWQAGLFDLYVAREAVARYPVDQQDSVMQIHMDRIAERLNVKTPEFVEELNALMEREPKRFIRLMDSVESMNDKYKLK